MDFMDLCQHIAFDDDIRMDTIDIETSFSHEDFCEPSCDEPVQTCSALDEEEETEPEPAAPPDARRVSTDSDASSDVSRSSSDAGEEGSSTAAGGDDIFDEYDVLPTLLGTGNYGCVRECLHRSSGEKYAVKTIEKSKVVRKDHLRREIEFLRSVDHPSVLNLVDCYEDDEYVHIVTEICAGGELFDRIVDRTTDDGCLAEGEAKRIIQSLLEAVSYLHSRNIVHRDIKPENLLFESPAEDAAVKLIDFGLSRTHAKGDRAMTNRVGTPYYMSPAVLEGHYDRSCDLWAAGVTAYIVLTGYPPFNGGSDGEVHDSVRRGDLRFERRVWTRLSPDARDFVGRLLSRDSSRMTSADEALRHPWMTGK